MAYQPLNIGEYSVFLEETNSTNDALKLLYGKEELPEGALVYTYFQSNGRGQQNAVWESERGKNLLLSVLLKPHFLPADEQIWLNLVFSLALRDAATALSGMEAKIKWPNDIYLEGKKVAGILIENSIQGMRLRYTIAGIGLNLNQEKFSVDKAASLFNFSGNWVEPNLARQLFCEKLSHYYALLLGKQHNLLWEKYHQYLLGKGEMARFEKDGQQIEAEILGIDKRGRLHLLYNEEIKSFAHKEIIFIELIK